MAAKSNGSKSNLLIMGFIVALCLSIPVMFFFVDKDKPDAGDSIVGPDGRVREDYDPGVAWLQSKPIMMPDVGGIKILRATMRMKNRESAKTVCSRHPHLADTVLKVLTDNKGLMHDALSGESLANKEIHDAISDRIGTDLFTATIISDDNVAMMKDTDKVRYECGSEGLRLIFRNPPS